MTARVFLDTNLLVYAHDRSEPEKQRRAILLLDRLISAGAAVISAQVLSEFYAVVTRKIAEPLSNKDASAQVERFCRTIAVLPVTSFVVLEALRGVAAYQMHFWDAQIWAAARMNQISLVLSEDFNAGAVLDGVRFRNPFASEVDFHYPA